MLIKTGGGDPSLGQAGEGIHWHMNIANKITYFATDEQRQIIPWVRMEDAQGHVTEYATKDNPPSQEADRQGQQTSHGLHRLPQSSDRTSMFRPICPSIAA